MTHSREGEATECGVNGTISRICHPALVHVHISVFTTAEPQEVDPEERVERK